MNYLLRSTLNTHYDLPQVMIGISVKYIKWAKEWTIRIGLLFWELKIFNVRKVF